MTNEYGMELDSNGYAPSLLSQTETRCFLCGRSDEKLDRHEIFHGPFRQKSKRLGLWVPLCHTRCHLGGVHKNADIDISLKTKAQKAAMRAYKWDIPTFITKLGKNYL